MSDKPTPTEYDPYADENCWCAAGEMVWQVQPDGTVKRLESGELEAEAITERYTRLARRYAQLIRKAQQEGITVSSRSEDEQDKQDDVSAGPLAALRDEPDLFTF